MREHEPLDVTFEPHYFVRASGLGSWTGEDFRDTLQIVRGELGTPHLPYLPELAERGYFATTLARTITCLDGLKADGASFGWRLVSGFARESERARSLFASDINALADAVGKETSAGDTFKLQLTGPISLASSLYLPNGERAISDSGATRDIRDSLIAGLEPWIKLLQDAVPQEKLIIQFDEYSMEAVLAGSIATASGFNRYRPLGMHRVEESYEKLNNSLKSEGVAVAVNGAPFAQLERTASTSDACAFSIEKFEERDWEQVASLIELGKQVWLGVVSGTKFTPVSHLAHRLWKSWRMVGLDASTLTQLTLTESGRLSAISPSHATATLRHLTETARALSEIAQENS